MAKKIGAIVSLSIIGILILATIIMANVNVNYKVDCKAPTAVWVNYNSNEPTKERVVTDADDVVSLINNASKEKALTAMFNGTLNKKAKLVAVSGVGKTLPTIEGFYVRYRYENAQKAQDDVYYSDLVFEVKNMEGTNLLKVYLIPDSTSPKTYTHYYELEANFESLYDYLMNNGYNI